MTAVRRIGTADLFECQRCRIVKIKNGKVDKKKLEELYCLKDYLTNEKRQRKKFSKLATIVVKKGNYSKVLDVGSGYGLFVQILANRISKNIKSSKNLGGSFSGNNNNRLSIDAVEPSQRPYFLPKDACVYKQTYERFLQSANKKYDLVLMMDVLEHFDEPLKNLVRTKKILDEKGILVIQTPNYQSLIQRLCPGWSWWMVEDHRYLFSVKSIKDILKRAGYEIEFFRTYEDYYSFKKNLDGNFTSIENIFLRRTIKLIFFSCFIPLYFIFRPILWFFGYGGLIFLVVRPLYNNT
ncbi:class I SAM-dependent methyltransferase [Candidatus Roizmanbacteria bacterium]|nr:class I SAM-dependent methyltransferase [Candidatus Roizmanbacteria bacterium]